MASASAVGQTGGERPSRDGVLAALYDGVMATAGFQQFIEQLIPAFALRSVTLMIRHEHSHEVEGLWLHGLTQAWLEKYALRYAAEDMLAQHIRSVPAGRFYASNLDLPYQEQIPLSRFYREWLEPQGIAYAAGGIVWREGNWCTELFVQRGSDHAPFSQDEVDDLDALLPHIERAIKMRQRFATLQRGQNFLSASFDLLTTPVFFLDEHCRVTYFNRGAEQFLAANPVVFLRDNHLLVTESQASRTLNFAIGSAIQISRGEAASLTEVVRLPRGNRQPLLLRVAPMRLRAALALNPGALVFAFDPEVTPDLKVHTVRTLFDLTDAEAGLAVALCNGKMLDEIATQRAVTLHTIKSQLKTLFVKTGTSRQAELVALLLVSPASFLSDGAGSV